MTEAKKTAPARNRSIRLGSLGAAVILVVSLQTTCLSAEDPKIEAWKKIFERGKAEYKTGKLAEAEIDFLSAVEAAEKVSDKNIVLSTSLSALGAVYRDRSKFADAEKTLARVVKLDEGLFGLTNKEVGPDLEELAQVYALQGKNSEAVPLLMRAVDIDYKAHGDIGPTASARANLAGVYADLGKYTEAEPLAEKAVSANITMFGNSPDALDSLSTLGTVLRLEGKYAEAERPLLRAVDIAQKSFGPEDPHLAHHLNDLGKLYEAEKKYKEAEDLFKKTLEIGRKTLGADDPSIGVRESNLASVYLNEKRYAEAEPLFKSALSVYEKHLPRMNQAKGNALNRLATLYNEQRKYADAEPLFKQAIGIAEATNNQANADKYRKAYDEMLKSRDSGGLPSSNSTPDSSTK